MNNSNTKWKITIEKPILSEEEKKIAKKNKEK